MVSISVGEKIMTDLMSEIIKTRLKADGKRYFAADNISEYILDDYERQQLIDELASKFQGVLSSLIIDTDNDPNSEGTANRLAKMYINEIMSGRYNPMPNPNSFPNYVEDGYEGMLVVRSVFTSSPNYRRSSSYRVYCRWRRTSNRFI